MNAESKTTPVYEFDSFRLDPGNRVLTRLGEPVEIGAQTFDLLLLLVENAGQLVTKEQIFEQVWQAEFVRDGTLRFGLHRLRGILGDEGHEFIHTVKGRGYRFTAAVREITPAEQEQSPEADPEIRRVPLVRQRGVQLVIAACALLVVVLAVFTFIRLRGSDETNKASRRSMAVLGFHNLSGQEEAAWISTALSEMLSVELAAGGVLRTVPGESVSTAKADLEFASEASFAAKTLQSIHQRLGADLVLVGSYLSMEQQSAALRIDLQVQDTQTGEILVAVSRTGKISALAEMVSSLGAELRQGLAAGTVGSVDAEGIAAAYPPNPDVARLYSAGLTRLRRSDALGARVLLEEAVEADPDYPLTHSALSLAWSHLGYDDKAAEQAALALSLSGDLPWTHRQEIRARQHATEGEWSQAVFVHEALWSAFPDNPEYALGLAAAQIAADRPRDALETAGQFRRISTSPSEITRIDFLEAVAYQALAEYRRSDELAARAEESARQARARTLEGRCLLVRGECARRLGHPEQALEQLDRARQVFIRTGDRGHEIQALGLIGAVRGTMGDHEAAARIFQDGVLLAREIGARRVTAQLLGNLAAENTLCGRLGEADEQFNEAIREYRKIGSVHGAALALANSAVHFSRLGRLGESEERLVEALLAFREIGSTDLISLTLTNLAATREQTGKLELAQKNALEALVLARQQKQPRRLGRALLLSCELLTRLGRLKEAALVYEQANPEIAEIGSSRSVILSQIAGSGIRLARGDLDQAALLASRALESAQDAGDQITIAECQAQAASIALARNEHEKALEWAESALRTFERLEESGSVFSSRKTITTILLAQQRPDAARVAIDTAWPQVSTGESVHAKLSFDIARALVSHAVGSSQAAIGTLETTLDQALRLSDQMLAFEAKLALGQIEMVTQPEAGRARLESLIRDADQAGYGLFTTRARQLLTGSRTNNPHPFNNTDAR